ncbi:sensor histidine kinase [Bogoriella caseilytica]|uniref:histidine kinase n=1 Tax=Bogoriella caseilytica TaxID=56055 RepID=A0A3N2BAC4_9MICO|nr:sensor histidine kinase [Bogoriella caseilytica]ROR72024.1 signal transduction histidine kinase [Bogoriella caseilytica]
MTTASSTSGYEPRSFPARVVGALRNPRWFFPIDLALAVLAFLTLMPTGFILGTGTGYAFEAPLPPLLFVTIITVCSLTQCVAVAWRRTRPATSAAVIYAAALVHYLAGAPILPSDLLVLVALYSVTRFTRSTQRSARWAGLIGALIGAAMIGLLTGPSPWGYSVGQVIATSLAVSAVVLATWALAMVLRVRDERVLSLEEHARRLEIEREQQLRLAATAERTRIAREMHDVVAHSLSVVIAQADGGRYAAQSDPEAAARALETISTTGRDALADMRRVLGVLRTENDRSPDDAGSAAPVRPEPGHLDIDGLVAQVKSTGLAVSVVRTGPERSLPAGVGLAVYRIVQEALTNSMKHAGPNARVTVAQHWRSEALILQIDDDGRGAATLPDGLGQGLLGMRERAEIHGGTLTAGPRPGGGFRIHAVIPLPAPTPGA